MKLYALLTFLLALPLFVRLLPESADDSSASAPTPNVAPAEPAPESTGKAKPAEKSAQKPLEKPADTQVHSPEPTH